MFRPVPFFIGLRYTRAKRRNHFISFISLASMLGIALGITVLITVLSVMNGFDHQIQTRIFGMARQVTVLTTSGKMANWQGLQKQVEGVSDVKGAAPFVSGQGMLYNLGVVHPVMISGILPDQEAKVSKMDSFIKQGSFKALTTGSRGIVMGESLAGGLGLQLGDKVSLITPQATVTPLGFMPRYQRFTIVGLFRVGGGFGFDDGVAFINLHDAQKLFQMGDKVSGLRLKVDELYAAPKVSYNLSNILPERYLVQDWTQQYGAFFSAIRMEKTMMFAILLLIIAVAVFNLVSSLVMIVTDKQSEIAILRTIGATPRMIMSTFIIQGCIVGFIGTLLGLVGGVTLALNASRLEKMIENIFHVHLIPATVYFVDYLPSRLEWTDVFHVCLISLGLALLATIYPAWQAARTQPAEALRYE